MENEQINEIKGCLLKARNNHFNQTKSFSPESVLKKSIYEFTIEDSPPLIILDSKGIKALNEAIEITKNDDTINKFFSTSTIRRKVEKVLKEIILSDPKGIDPFSKVLITNLIDTLQNSAFIEWEIIIPIVNLLLKVSEFKIGNVIFVYGNETYFADHINYITTTIKDNDPQLEPKKYLKNKVIPSFYNKTLGIVKVSAVDSEHAMELGREEIEKALNILRLYSRGTQYNDSIFYRMYVGREGHIFKSQEPVIHSSFKSKTNDPHLKLNYQKTGYLHPYVIDLEIINRMNLLSFNIINQILLKKWEEHSDFEKLLLRSIEFYGQGLNDSNKKFSFIYFIIALEILLTSSYEPQKGLIAERTALIIRDSINDRIEIFDEMERLYRLRSFFLHQGIDSITYSDISILSYIAFQTIIKLLSITDILHQSQLIDKLNKIKLSNPNHF
jgi:hypothetical protein